MHVAWLILKIILLSFGIFLGLALILLLALLFVPFRYRVEAVFSGKPDVKLRVSWMSFFLDFRAYYREGKFRYFLKSFWVVLASKDSPPRNRASSSKGIFGGRRKGRDDGTGKKSNKTSESEIPVIDTSVFDGPELDWEAELEPWEKGEREGVDVSEENNGSHETVWNYIRSFFRGLEIIFTFPARLTAAVYRLWRKLRDVMDYFWNAVDRLLVKLKLIDKKREQLVKLYGLPTTKTAVSNCKGYLLDLLAHLKPEKLTGNLIIGLKDPAATGQLFGVLGLLLPVYYDNIDLTADFGRERLEGNIHMKGGITVACLLWILLKIYRDKYTMKTYERVRRILGGNKDGKRI